jgi:hypothetical protein
MSVVAATEHDAYHHLAALLRVSLQSHRLFAPCESYGGVEVLYTIRIQPQSMCAHINEIGQTLTSDTRSKKEP